MACRDGARRLSQPTWRGSTSTATPIAIRRRVAVDRRTVWSPFALCEALIGFPDEENCSELGPSLPVTYPVIPITQDGANRFRRLAKRRLEAVPPHVYNHERLFAHLRAVELLWVSLNMDADARARHQRGLG
jgi:hypothetical protein